jgi:RNA polymerase sigma factor (sigma-70 family)
MIDPDRELIDAFAANKDAAAFGAIVERHRDFVFDMARRILGDEGLAEDIAQETFLALYQKLLLSQPISSLRPWLLGVARHLALTRRTARGRRRSREVHSTMIGPEKIVESTPAASFESAELNAALKSLPQDIQIPVVLHYRYGLAHSEVAAVLKIPDGTVASRIARGLERLRAILEGKGRTVSATAGIVVLEAGLKSLPLAKAPSSVSALDVIQKFDAARMVSKSTRHMLRSAPKAGGHIVLTSVLATVAIAGGGIWWAVLSPATKSPILMPRVEITAADISTFNFNFETAENFSRFKQLFAAALPKQNPPFAGMEMKYEPGKVIFHSADRENGYDYFLKAESVKLGTNWEISYRINTSIGLKEINVRPYKRAGIDIRFEHPNNGELIHNLDGYARLSMSMLSDFDGFLVCRLIGPGMQDNEDDSPIFKGMKSTGIAGSGYLSQGKVVKPASLDGTYDVALTMRNGHMKIIVNESVVIDDELPEALAHQIESSALTIDIWTVRQDLELERFKFSRLLNVK